MENTEVASWCRAQVATCHGRPYADLSRSPGHVCVRFCNPASRRPFEQSQAGIGVRSPVTHSASDVPAHRYTHAPRARHKIAHRFQRWVEWAHFQSAMGTAEISALKIAPRVVVCSRISLPPYASSSPKRRTSSNCACARCRLRPITARSTACRKRGCAISRDRM